MTPKLSRRETLMVTAGVLAWTLGSRSAGAGIAGAQGALVTSLGDLAAEAGVTFGTSIAADTLTDPGQAALYRHHARILTVDWALKLNVLRPAADVFDTAGADAIVAFAREAGLPLRGHCLAWNESRPDWLTALSAREKRTALERHIDETAGRYAGALESWDVVNEPFWPGHGLAGGWRDGPWLEAFGSDYPVEAFKRAEAAAPGCRLVLNEAHTEQWTETGAGIRAGLLTLVDRIQDAGCRLDAVGLQGHLQPQWAYDDAGFQEFLFQLAERKVELMITELDVNDEAFPDDPLVRDAAVADRYEAFLDAVLAVPALKTVIAWQLTDMATWYRDVWAASHPGSDRKPRPLPFDAELAPKIAYDAIASAFRKKATG